MNRQREFREAQRRMLGDPECIYRLPGFNRHRSESKASSKSVSAFQTPKEARTFQHLQSLNQSLNSSSRTGEGGRTLRARPRRTASQQSSEGCDMNLKRSFSGFAPGAGPAGSSSGGAFRFLPSRTAGSADTAGDLETLGSDFAVQVNVAELLKRAETEEANRPGSRQGPPSPSVEPSSALGTTTVGSGATGSGGGGEGSGGGRGSACLVEIEAAGGGQAWIPHSRMPDKMERFATYPAVKLRRDGLAKRPNGFHPTGQVGLLLLSRSALGSWPLEAPLGSAPAAGVRPLATPLATHTLATPAPRSTAGRRTTNGGARRDGRDGRRSEGRPRVYGNLEAGCLSLEAGSDGGPVRVPVASLGRSSSSFDAGSRATGSVARLSRRQQQQQQRQQRASSIESYGNESAESIDLDMARPKTPGSPGNASQQTTSTALGLGV